MNEIVQHSGTSFLGFKKKEAPTEQQLALYRASRANHTPGKVIEHSDGTRYRVMASGQWRRENHRFPAKALEAAGWWMEFIRRNGQQEK